MGLSTLFYKKTVSTFCTAAHAFFSHFSVQLFSLLGFYAIISVLQRASGRAFPALLKGDELLSLAVFWQPCATGARALRVMGDSPCPVVPDIVAGLPVTEIGPYCFAARASLPPTASLWPAGADASHPLCGDFLEQVTLPDSVTVLHSAAFYNCRRLTRLEAGPALRDLGSDLFTNCRALTTLALRAAPNAPTGLKKLVGAISADVSAVFLSVPGAALHYPEYTEFLDENTPAHIFNHSIEGEGYRLRQCFTNAGSVDFAAYDAAFSQAQVAEPPAKLCRMALARLCAPYTLAPQPRARYETYLRTVPDAAFALVLAGRDTTALRLLCSLGLPTARAAAQFAEAGWSEGAALLLSARHPARRAPQYDFDDL